MTTPDDHEVSDPEPRSDGDDRVVVTPYDDSHSEHD
jgi:hypothetical protein